MRPVVITACTNRKRHAPDPSLVARSLPHAAIEQTCEEWISRLARVREPRARVQELYCGRAFQEALRASEALQADFFVVSAGLGLVSARASAPSYSLTLARSSEDCVLNGGSGSAQAWWAALRSASPFHEGDVDRGGLILAALSRPYLEMVAADWAHWPSQRVRRLRLFCLDPPSSLPGVLAEQLMPYDARLDALEGWAGTRGDFAQRALHHFAKNVAGVPASASDHAAAVTSALAHCVTLPWPVRERRDDDEVTRLILREWDAVEGRSGAMLRRLRRDLNIACEQGRFKELFKRAAAQRQGVLL